MNNFLKKFLLSLLLVCGGLTLNAQDNQSLIQAVMDEKASTHNLSIEDVQSWEVTDTHEDQKSGVTFYYLTQKYNGLLLHNAISVVTVKDKKAMFSANGFINELVGKTETSTATISAKDAIIAAANSLGLEFEGDIIQREKTADNQYVFSAEGLSKEEINVQLKLFLTEEGKVRAVWDFAIYELGQEHWWSIRVDAQTSEVLDKTDWVLSCSFESKEHSYEEHQAHHQIRHQEEELPSPNDPVAIDGAGYNVYAIPIESPIHGSRSIVMNPADPVASPYGWHDTNGYPGPEFTDTRGNNVYASEDWNNSNTLGYRPSGGSSLNFNFPLNFNQAPANYIDAAVTNLFYMNNIMHDVWYQYGFDEASGNFQRNNYGKGGWANDHVDAQAQDGGGMNNANFATPPDGSRPRMQMYLWSPPTPNYFTVNSPSTISGGYYAIQASFGPNVPTSPITSDIVIYNDNVGDPMDACQSPVNGSAMNGKIVLVKRGDCNFTDKVQNAENNGATAVIVVNNVGGNPITMGGTDPGIGIPSIMISNTDGAAIIDQIQNNIPVNATFKATSSNYNLDGDFDNGIIAHEYGHGISIRLTGGASTSNCLNNREQMGEGWSDWFGLMLTIKPGDVGETGRGIGTYAAGESSNGQGIRPLRYSTDFNVNYATYGITNNTSSISMPHGIGFVWATMLWDMSWALIDKHGFDSDVYNGTGGNNIAMHLVINGLKLQNCSPGFVDGRDAILLADQILYNGENQCLLWEVFANRGLGYSASQGSSNSRTDQVEAFDLPPYIGTTTGSETVVSCGDFTWPTNNQTYTSSGSYTEYLINSNGCDSIVTLNLTISDSETYTVTKEKCESYIWPANGQTYSTSGTYTETFIASNGCDSIVTLDLTINNAVSSTETEETCESYIWPANGQTYSTSGTYTEILTAVSGCDSIVTLDLTINNAVSSTETEETCGSYIWPANGQTYSTSGTYTEILTAVSGCDSIVTLDLTINNAVSSTETEETCGSYIWPANGQTYSTSGTYTETLTAVSGCDSIVTLDLTINNAVSSTETEETCESYIWPANGQTYSTSGTYTETLTAVSGCDSIVTLDLTINNAVSSTETEETCESYIWPANGQTYSTSGTYTETLTAVSGCDSIVTLDLTINNAESSTETEETCESYIWPANGQTYSTSGTYTETLTAVSGCDSIVTLDLTINNAMSSTETEETCESYIWPANGQTYSTSGTYTETFNAVNGCDSIVTLDLTINNAVSSTVEKEACGSYIWSANGQTYTTSGVYTETFTGTNGCDSLLTLNLTISNSDVYSVFEEACESYTWPANGQTYAASGVYSETYSGSNGCDSIVTLNLTINNAVSSSTTKEACGSYTWPANGQTYTTSGSYTETFNATTGCDSLVTLNLTISNSDIYVITEEACESFIWSANGETYFTSGSYTETFNGANGCDSILTLDLTINNSINTTTTKDACESYTWVVNGQTYTETGVYVETFNGANGCDSIVTLDLTIGDSDIYLTTEEACGSYTWEVNGETYSTSGVYTETYNGTNGCDSIVQLDLTINGIASSSITEEVCDSFTWSTNGQTYSESGVYTETFNSANGCDSIVTLNLTITDINTTISFDLDGVSLIATPGYSSYQWLDCDKDFAPISGATNTFFSPLVNGNYAVVVSDGVCSDTSDCLIVYQLNIEEEVENNIKIYPNPTDGMVNVDFMKPIDGATIKVYDMIGKLVQELNVGDQNQFQLYLKGESGVYTIEIHSLYGIISRTKLTKLN